VRVGIGFDSHRFDSGRPLLLGGVRIPDHPGLAGHSDGDAVIHALIDALLGAAAMGDVGELFPDTDGAWQGADSMTMLERVADAVRGHGFNVWNVDMTIICESPRIAPWKEQMRRAIGARLGLPIDRVSIKGKTNEGMGWIGRAEGLAVLAVALLHGVAGQTEAGGE